MPIITTQRRMTEKGRIRLGEKVTGTTKNGKEYTRPAKLERFRFTSADRDLIEAIAAQYGGTARPWDNAGKSEFEVLSEATSIPVYVVKGGFSQWHEVWSKAGLQHRCDGEKDATGAYCDPDDPVHREAIEKPITRLSVMLEEIESVGVWRLETKGWNAAAELPAMADLAMYVGNYVPAVLSLAERSSIIQTDKGPQTSRFVVPTLDLRIGHRRLREVLAAQAGSVGELEGSGERPALNAGSADVDPFVPHFTAVEAAADHDALAVVWDAAKDEGLVGPGAADTPRAREFLAAFKARAAAVKPTGSQPAPDADGVVDAELVPEGDDGDADAIWQQILKAGGERGMSLPDVEQDCSTFLGGMSSAEASAGELSEYLADLSRREQVAS